MKLTPKIYKTIKTKHFIKTTSIYFFFNSTNKKAIDWINTEKNLKTNNFQYYKIFNRIASKTFQNSTFKSFKSIINGISFFISPFSYLENTIIKKTFLFNNFEPLLFKLMAIKLNNKIYSVGQFKKTYSLNYKDNKMLLYQFGIVNLKIYLTKKA